MPVFISLVTDVFAKTFQQRFDAAQRARRAGTDRARRPMRGLEIKSDTYAYLKIVRSDGSEIKLLDSGSPDGFNTQYSNFILQSVNEQRMEKHQIIDTFGEPYIYFFGEAPRFIDVSAVLLDSQDFNWYAEFWENYERYFRGTRSVELGARTYLFYDDNVVEGYVLLASAQKVAEQPLMARLNFRMFVTRVNNVSFVGDPMYPVRANVNLPPSVDLTTADPYTVGTAGAAAAAESAKQESLAIQAAAGARQQAAGFGGGKKLSDAVRGGMTNSGEPFVDGILGNALRATATAGISGRTMPLRGKIADNYDEFTALVPSPPGTYSAENDHDGEPEAYDVMPKATEKAAKHGADVNNPNTWARMGMGPYFMNPGGTNFGGSGPVGATFGVGAGVGGFGAGTFRQTALTNTVAGGRASIGASLNIRVSAGIGISVGRGNAIMNLQQVDARNLQRQFQALGPYGSIYNSAYDPYNPANPYFKSGAYTFGNGVPISGGMMGGTGIGGGIPGGLSSGIGPDGAPGTLTQFSGGQSFGGALRNAGPYMNGLSANGPVLNVGGAPTAFSTIAVPGTFQPNGLGLNPYGPPPLGTATGSLFIGPDGVSSSSNTTGIFA